MNSNIGLPDFENSSPPTTEVAASAPAVAWDKGAAALKTHSESERRRRKRINGHLATLRTLIPDSSKMDKASLLAKAIIHLKELEKSAAETTRGLIIPLDFDEASVEEVVDVRDGDASVCIKASVCCDYRHEILSDLRKSLNSLHLKLVRVEMGTFAGRMKSVFFMSSVGEENKYVSGSAQRALRSLLDSFSASQEFSSGDLLPSKRQRVSLLSCSSTYSSSGNFCCRKSSISWPCRICTEESRSI